MLELSVSQRCMCTARPCIRAPTGPEPLIDRPGSPTSCSQPALVIDSQSGPWRWEAWPGLTEPGASQRATWRGCGGREANFQGLLTQVEEPIFWGSLHSRGGRVEAHIHYRRKLRPRLLLLLLWPLYWGVGGKTRWGCSGVCLSACIEKGEEVKRYWWARVCRERTLPSHAITQSVIAIHTLFYYHWKLE